MQINECPLCNLSMVTYSSGNKYGGELDLALNRILHEIRELMDLFVGEIYISSKYGDSSVGMLEGVVNSSLFQGEL